MADREVSTIAFYDRHKRILLQDRRSISKFGEQWGFFGGSVEKNETPTDAVIREIKEELDYSFEKPPIFFKSYTGSLPNGKSFIEHVHVALFPGFNKVKQKEGDGMRLFPVSEIRKKLVVLETYKTMLDDLEEYLN